VDANDIELRRRFAAGDRDAFAALAGPLLDTLFTLALRMTGSLNEADDVAQEALVRALQNHSAYDPQRPFRPWLLTVTANLCRDRVRSTWWLRVVELVHSPADHGRGADAALAENESDAAVRHALSTISSHY
jgi:RNA polymerase sigma-70 factor, ECF subfamily